ncbi:MAG: sugar ABC transporter substrate-binding protein [Clostridia bacterium]|nr:sugar ABC transporter substrate-binding protein [Clostridia bacterium]
MKKNARILTILLALCLVLTACGGQNEVGEATPAPTATPEISEDLGNELNAFSSDVIDADLNCTITLGNWPPDTAAASEIALFEGYKATMEKQYPNVTLVPDYYSYSLSNYVPMAKGGTAPSIFQPPFTDPQLLISQHLVGDVTDALAEIGVLDKFSPSYVEMLADQNGRIYGLPRDGYVLGMHINIELFREAGLIDEEGLPIYPKTLQELAEYGQIIREKTGKAGLVFPASETYGGWLFTNIAWNFGCVGESALEYQDETGRWVCNFTSPECIAAMEYMRSLKWEYDILNADATTTDWAGAHSELGTGEAAMNFAADDSVDQPTSNKGLPIEDFALIPFPAGPSGRYALAGGTCYMFSPNITPDQARALMAYLKILGKLPFLDDDIVAGMRADYAAKKDRGAPVLPAISAWNDEEYNATKRAIIDEYCNVDMRLYNDFFDSVSEGTITLKAEEPVFAQQLYRELTSVIQRVITRENADVVKALREAQESFQEYLDDEINS